MLRFVLALALFIDLTQVKVRAGAEFATLPLGSPSQIGCLLTTSCVCVNRDVYLVLDDFGGKLGLAWP